MRGERAAACAASLRSVGRRSMIGGLSLPLPAAAAPAEAELESVACSKAAKKASSAALKPSPPLLPAVVEGSGVAVEDEAS